MKIILSKFVSSVTMFAMILTIVAPLLSFPGKAVALDTGFASPSTSGDNENDWSNGSNAFASDDTYATETSEDQDQSYEDFGFSVPSGATIDGIEVNVEAKHTDATGCQAEVRMWSESDNEFTDRINQGVTGTDAVYTLGSSSNLWNSTWTPSDFTNGNFFLEIQFDDTSSSSCDSGTFSLDHVQVKVHYTEPEEPAENPELGGACGLDIALVLDSSGSIGTNLATMKTAFEGFVDAFDGTPTEFSVTDFDDDAIVLQVFTDDTTAVKTAINLPTSGGATNWEDGLLKAGSTLPHRTNPNLIVFASDGNPTVNNDSSATGGVTDGNDLINAISVANTIKAGGTRIVTLGVGGTVTQANLEAISSADAYYSSATFANLATTLEEIVTDLCGGSINITKVIDADGNLETIGDQTDGEGWAFTVSGETPVITNENGQASVAVDQDTYDVTETVMPGYTLVDAMCEGADGNGSLDGNTIFGVEVGSEDVVTCTFYNTTIKTPTSDVTLCKEDGSQNPLSGWELYLDGEGENNYGGITGENGCVLVEDVPFGEYILGEVLTAGWVNVSGEGDEVTIDNEGDIFTLVNRALGECEDNVDNADQEDGLADEEDPGCWNDPNDSNTYNPNDPSETLVDACPNGDTDPGFQLQGPCNSEDVCSNILGIQTELPENHGFASAGICVPDQCPNDPGIQVNLDQCTPEETEAKIVATKILCPAEDMLPNWGNDDGDDPELIDENTANNFLAENEECDVVAWDFEWASRTPENTENPGNNLNAGGDGWNLFEDGMAFIPTEEQGYDSIWVREQMEEGYVPFSGSVTSDEVMDEYSAEIYCHTDLLNYVNYDWIEPLVAGQTYHCVAFNVAEEPEQTPSADLEITKTSDVDGAVDEGDSVVYTITVVNNGPDTAENVVVNENLPACLALDGEPTVGKGTYNPGTGVWEVGDLADEESVTLEIPVLVDDCEPGTVENTANTTSETEDPNEENNEDEETIVVRGEDNDVCPNIDGVQEEVPNNMHLDDGQCVEDNGGGGGSSSSGSRRSSGSTPGEVLGEATEICNWTTQYLRRGWKGNVPNDVQTMQNFLNLHMNSGLVVDSLFGPLTEAAVRSFQVKYIADILTPWGISQSTGIWYLSTTTKAKEIMCGAKQALPALINWSKNPAVVR